MSDRSVRSLVQLQNNASPARVLNLHKVWSDHPAAPPAGARLFDHPLLDRSLVIKHRLRRDEMDLFAGRRHAATKIILPIDNSDLKLGGHSIFVGQTGYVRCLEQAFGAGFERTTDFETPSAAQVSRLVHKILSDPDDPDMEPLRQTLRLRKDEWAEGMFCWKGFLYYKWSLCEVANHVGPVLEHMGKLRPAGPIDEGALADLARSRVVLRRAVQRACAVTSETLRVYDDAYAKLVRDGAPAAFREFLLDAPAMFSTLGERLGAISHVVSFWRYRFPPGVQTRVSVEELLDVFMEFESSLNFPEAAAPASAEAA